MGGDFSVHQISQSKNRGKRHNHNALKFSPERCPFYTPKWSGWHERAASGQGAVQSMRKQNDVFAKAEKSDDHPVSCAEN